MILLSNTYKSRPRNKIIADVCKDMRIIEKYGSGIWRISDYLKKDGLPASKFENIAEGFQVTVYSEDYEGFKNRVDTKIAEKVTERLGERLGENQKKIIELIQNNSFITIPELSRQIHISETAIQNNIAKLKSIGLITRKGPDKGGHWKVL
jgi:ATP-dependent DNA helicase RecG